jgi:predicted ArsR family transcriptional regulator
MAKVNVKRGRKPVKRQDVLLSLREQSNRTRHDLGVSASYIAHLIEAGLIQKTNEVVFHVDDQGAVRRGRPLHTYKLTRKGAAQATRLADKIAAPVAEPVAV